MVPLVGVSDASTADCAAYLLEQGYAFPILADAAAVREAWGVDMVWGNVVRLVDPDGIIAAVGFAASAAVLEAR